MSGERRAEFHAQAAPPRPSKRHRTSFVALLATLVVALAWMMLTTVPGPFTTIDADREQRAAIRERDAGARIRITHFALLVAWHADVEAQFDRLDVLGQNTERQV